MKQGKVLLDIIHDNVLIKKGTILSLEDLEKIGEKAGMELIQAGSLMIEDAPKKAKAEK